MLIFSHAWYYALWHKQDKHKIINRIDTARRFLAISRLHLAAILYIFFYLHANFRIASVIGIIFVINDKCNRTYQTCKFLIFSPSIRSESCSYNLSSNAIIFTLFIYILHFHFLHFNYNYNASLFHKNFYKFKNFFSSLFLVDS